MLLRQRENRPYHLRGVSLLSPFYRMHITIICHWKPSPTLYRIWHTRWFVPLIKGWLLPSPPVYFLSIGCEELDSNQRPSAYGADELPTALSRNILLLLINSKIYTKFFMYILPPIGSNLEPIDGLEPPTY